MTEVQFHTTASGIQIAFRHLKARATGEAEYAAGPAPTAIFLPGYMSDMDGGKAAAVHGFCEAHGFGCLLLDYSGCGRSEGQFADGTLSLWRGEVLSLIDACSLDKVVLIGSSMGGWLMLLIALELGDRLSGMIGIAAAPDFSDWGFSATQKAALSAGQTIFEDNPYGPEPTPTHAHFWQDAETHRQLGSAIGIYCPVRLLHGQKDADVPWETTMLLAQQLRSDDIQLSLVKDGDHRLSRENDIKLLLSQLRCLLE